MKKMTRAIKQGLKAVSAPLHGCIKDMELDGRGIGLPEVLETLDVRSGCSWDFPCSRSPCGHQETCRQDGLSGHTCVCEGPDPCGETAAPPIGIFLAKHLMAVEYQQTSVVKFVRKKDFK